jgi:ABC-type multidrug transport system ATPase subunit
LARAGLFYLPARQILDPFIAVERQLTAVSQYFGGSPIPDFLARFGLSSVATQRPASLSGGELRRAELAVAVARQAACLVADEPFRGLDPRDIEGLAAAIRAIADAGAAVVVTGHELAPLRGLADAVVWCVAGSSREFPEASSAWADPQLQQESRARPPVASARLTQP